MISLEKWKISTTLPKNVGDLGKIIVTTSLEKLPLVQKIAQSGHTERKGTGEWKKLNEKQTKLHRGKRFCNFR